MTTSRNDNNPNTNSSNSNSLQPIDPHESAEDIAIIKKASKLFGDSSNNTNNKMQTKLEEINDEVFTYRLILIEINKYVNECHGDKDQLLNNLVEYLDKLKNKQEKNDGMDNEIAINNLQTEKTAKNKSQKVQSIFKKPKLSKHVITSLLSILKKSNADNIEDIDKIIKSINEELKTIESRSKSLQRKLDNYYSLYFLPIKNTDNYSWCDLFLMSDSKTTNYKISDNTHLLLYKDDKDRFFYFINGTNKKQFLNQKKLRNEEIEVLKKEKFNSGKPLKCKNAETCNIVLRMTSKRGHTYCYLKNLATITGDYLDKAKVNIEIKNFDEREKQLKSLVNKQRNDVANKIISHKKEVEKLHDFFNLVSIELVANENDADKIYNIINSALSDFTNRTSEQTQSSEYDQSKPGSNPGAQEQVDTENTLKSIKNHLDIISKILSDELQKLKDAAKHIRDSGQYEDDSARLHLPEKYTQLTEIQKQLLSKNKVTLSTSLTGEDAATYKKIESEKEQMKLDAWLEKLPPQHQTEYKKILIKINELQSMSENLKDQYDTVAKKSKNLGETFHVINNDKYYDSLKESEKNYCDGKRLLVNSLKKENAERLNTISIELDNITIKEYKEITDPNRLLRAIIKQNYHNQFKIKEIKTKEGQVQRQRGSLLPKVFQISSAPVLSTSTPTLNTTTNTTTTTITTTIASNSNQLSSHSTATKKDKKFSINLSNVSNPVNDASTSDTLLHAPRTNPLSLNLSNVNNPVNTTASNTTTSNTTTSPLAPRINKFSLNLNTISRDEDDASIPEGPRHKSQEKEKLEPEKKRRDEDFDDFPISIKEDFDDTSIETLEEDFDDSSFGTIRHEDAIEAPDNEDQDENDQQYDEDQIEEPSEYISSSGNQSFGLFGQEPNKEKPSSSSTSHSSSPSMKKSTSDND